MKDAFGGILNLFLISLFLIIVSGILALTVNYTKAFRMKNAVISAIEQYEGRGCFNSLNNTSCKEKVREEAARIGYHTTNISCPTVNGVKYTEMDGIYCYTEPAKSNGKKYYSVVTQVNIDIPIINRIMGLSFFQVHGDTRNIGE